MSAALLERPPLALAVDTQWERRVATLWIDLLRVEGPTLRRIQRDRLLHHLDALHGEPEWVDALRCARDHLLKLHDEPRWRRQVVATVRALTAAHRTPTWRLTTHAHLDVVARLHDVLIGRGLPPEPAWVV